MKSFKDTKGTAWNIAVNVNTVKRVRELAKFDLMKVAEDRDCIQQLSDPVTLVDVLYAACKPQADAAGINDEQFAEVLDGDVLELAATALMEDLADFFPKHRRGPLKSALAKIQQIQTKAAQLQIQRIESPALEAEVMAMVTAAVNAPLDISGASSTNSPGSPALTLAS